MTRREHSTGGRRSPRRRRAFAAAAASITVVGVLAGVAVGAGAAVSPRHHHGPGNGGGIFAPPVSPVPYGPGGPDGTAGVVTSYTPANGPTNGSLGLVERDGTALTVTTTSSTDVRYGGPDGWMDRHPSASATPPLLVVGDLVWVRLGSAGGSAGGTTTSSSPPAMVAEDVLYTQAVVTGTVFSVNGSNVVVTDASMFHVNVMLQTGTQYYEGGQSTTSAAVTTGADVEVFGTLDPTQTTLDADTVYVLEQEVEGVVVSVTPDTSGGATIVVDRFWSSKPVTVTTTSSTTFYAEGAAATLASVQPNDRISALGQRNVGGGLTANQVTVLPPRGVDPAHGAAASGGLSTTAPTSPGSGGSSTGSSGATGATGNGPPGLGRDGRHHHHHHGGAGNGGSGPSGGTTTTAAATTM